MIAPTFLRHASRAPPKARAGSTYIPDGRLLTLTDGENNRTTYGYGGLLTATLAAPTAGAVRPQTRMSYSQLSAQYKNHQGNIVAAYAPVYRLTATSACRTLGACAGTADEVKSTIAYGSAGAANNLLPTGTSTGDGAGALTATTAQTYDAFGNVLSVDGPLPGADDTVRFRYDAVRRPVGTVSPDPDGAGAMKMRAVRTSYNGDGNVSKVERGTVDGTGDADWAAFASLEAQETSYDTLGRPVISKLTSGATIHALTQTSYDARGRPLCTAQRMDSADFGAALPDACSLTSPDGSDGPDRITRAIYDNANQVVETRVAVGTADEAAEVRSTYTANGQVATLTDGENNRTTYGYDGHDRLSFTQYPVAAKGADASNPNDYESLHYLGDGDLHYRRQRDETVVVQDLDALGRAKRVFSWQGYWGTQEEVAYAYDNLGRVLQANKVVGGPGSVSFAYDALGRQVSETGTQGTVASQYDLAGRRTSLSGPGGYSIAYSHLVTGEMREVREGGGFVLASFAYDDLGRRTSLTRGNGTNTSYAYDPVSRLQTLTQRRADNAIELNLTFAYNPASQIASNTRSNDAYSWTGHGGSGTTASAANGLNQLASVGGSSVAHDGRGNMTADNVGRSFGYSLMNRLTSSSYPGLGTVTLGYDALGRLSHYNGGIDTRIAYDGQDRILEQDAAGNVLRTHVHGPGIDEPLVTYENGQRRYLHADERGSIVAASNNAGSVVAINRYDEYGLPAATNTGTFQYTGQVWMPEIGVYHYKARAYHPRLGRFLQADPIGYGDGMNRYGYVGGDPVNYTDPSGLVQIITHCSGGTKTIGPDGTIVITARVCTQTFVDDRPDAGSRGFTNGIPCLPRGRGGAHVCRPDEEEEEEIVITANCNATCRANLREQERIKWVLWGNRFMLNPYYNDPAPWLNLQNAIIIPPLIGAAVAILPQLGVAGSLFGRTRYTNDVSVFNSGNFRVGWSWNQNGWAGARNYFGPHGGTPKTPSHWHRTYIPGPKGPM